MSVVDEKSRESRNGVTLNIEYRSHMFQPHQYTANIILQECYKYKIQIVSKVSTKLIYFAFTFITPKIAMKLKFPVYLFIFYYSFTIQHFNFFHAILLNGMKSSRNVFTVFCSV